jgi:hypothetical protein
VPSGARTLQIGILYYPVIIIVLLFVLLFAISQ